MQRDSKKIEEGVRLILEGIGEDLSRPGLIDTPKRVAKAYLEMTEGLEKKPAELFEKRFAVAADEPICVKNISFYSLCEHHLLPFFGEVHIVYIPAETGEVCGLSKLARTVELYARRPQIQEQLGKQIAKAVYEGTGAKGVYVEIEAEHTCMTMRGVKKPGAKTTTISSLGLYKGDRELRREAHRMIYSTH